MLRIVAISLLRHALATNHLSVLVDNVVQRLARASHQVILVHHHHARGLLAVAVVGIPVAIAAIAMSIGIVSSGIAVAVVHRGQPGR